MRSKTICFGLALLAFMSGFRFQGALPASADRLQATDIVYKGAFRLPPGASPSGGFNATWNPDGNGGAGTLLIGGGELTDKVGEFAPVLQPSTSTTYSALPQATQINAYASIAGSLFSKFTSGCGQCRMPGLAYWTAAGHVPKLCWTIQNFYNVTASNDLALGCSNPLGQAANPQGMWHVGSWISTRTAGYAFPIPTALAIRFGHPTYTLCLGFNRQAGAFGGSQGPTVYCTNPWTDGSMAGQGAAIPGVALLYYDERIDCWNTNSCQFPNYQAPDTWQGAAYVTTGGKEAILLAGTKGLGRSTYLPGSGWSAPPYENRIILYDPNDLAAVAAGTKRPQSVVPYTSITVPVPFGQGGRGNGYGAYGPLGYDPVTARLYVLQLYVGPNYEPVVHAYQIAAGVLPNAPPPSPSSAPRIP